MIACSVPPPSRANLYVQLAPGHFIFYREIADAEERMRNAVRRHKRRMAEEFGLVASLDQGENADLFYSREEL